jgi:hypothetical protein
MLYDARGFPALLRLTVAIYQNQILSPAGPGRESMMGAAVIGIIAAGDEQRLTVAGEYK